MKQTDVQTRWQDMDALGHVNNAVVLNYLEEGRNALLAACGITPEDHAVGRFKVEFRAELDSRQGLVTVECGVKRLGRSSLATVERILTPQGDCAVEAEVGIVLWDPLTRRPRAITDKERAALDAYSVAGREHAVAED